MQQQQQQQRQVSAGEGMAANVGGKIVGGGGGGAAPCRPCARWTPTPEQIRILKELYYGCGIRSPNAEQIQRITAMLRQHGKIEGKNVFYWFQNHKARERQKRRLTNLDVNAPASAAAAATGAAADVGHLGVLSLSPSGMASPSFPAGMYNGNGGAWATQPDTSADWDTTAMATETCFLQDYMGVRSTGVHGHGVTTGAAVSPSPSPWACFTSPEQWAAAAATRATETLPLFPTGDDGRPRPRREGQDAAVLRGSYCHPCWGAAVAATATTTTTTVTIQQHQLLQQLQEQRSFCSSSSQLPSQDASLELTLSSWCSPYPAGTM
ncbi:hypothetical protein ACP70R_010788 [Stipagrostis hirtigluma subsp. patula]